MKKIKLGVISGGISTESDLTVLSAQTILKNIDKEKYEVFPIYLGKDRKWYKYIETQYKLGDELKYKKEIVNILEYLEGLDVILPHVCGKGGEDGTIQGLIQSINKPYVGCGILASCLGLDKAYAKIIFEKAGIKQAKYEYIRKYKERYFYVDKNMNQELLDIDEILLKIKQNLKFPLFVKPSNSGSSFGITKVFVEENLKSAIENASKFDSKILIEEEVKGREVECAVLGNEEVLASGVGEVKFTEDFYTYSEKFIKPETNNQVKADISKELTDKIRALAVKAFKAIDGRGLSRVDFFIEKETNEIYINEINTMPGFITNSMYPLLFEAAGISCKELLNKIIDLAFESHKNN
jgi:D-alanine-D-alanine ligase